jgi:hypothetical protein
MIEDFSLDLGNDKVPTPAAHDVFTIKDSTELMPLLAIERSVLHTSNFSKSTSRSFVEFVNIQKLRLSAVGMHPISMVVVTVRQFCLQGPVYGIPRRPKEAATTPCFLWRVIQ